MNKKLNMKTKFKTQKIRTLESKPRIRINANILDKPDKFKTQTQQI